jgi:hypothetical protein
LVRCDQDATNNLATFLKDALQLTSREVEALCWEPPRALMLELVPTLLRRLVRGWKKAHQTTPDDMDTWRNRHPLPDFLPQNLFSDLNLPEVNVVVPPLRRTDSPESESMAITFALAHLAPGRVTRRFADEAGVAHWSPIDIGSAQITLPIHDYARFTEFVGRFPSVGQPDAMVSVYRPHEIGLQRVDLTRVSASSNSRFLWHSRFSSQGQAITIDPPRRGPWSGMVLGVAFWLHRFQGSVSVVRYAQCALAELRLTNGREQTVPVRLVDAENQPAAVGFEIEVDGLLIDLRLPSFEELAARTLPDNLRASARTAFYRHLVRNDTWIPSSINTFQRDWLQQIFLSAAILRAERYNSTLVAAVTRLREEHDVDAYREVMDGIFAIQDIIIDDQTDLDDQNNEGNLQARPRRRRLERLRQRLTAHLQDPTVIQRLAAAVESAVNRDNADFFAWLRETLNNTIAEAILAAAVEVAPQHAALDTMVSDREEIENGDRVWITETTPGGAGTIEALAERIADEPRILFQALNAALATGDLEFAAETLSQIVKLAVEDHDIAGQLQALRAAMGHEARSNARERLFATLAQHGLPVGHTLAVSIAARLLRPGASAETDRLLHNLLLCQDALEARYGLSVGLREYAYLAAVLRDDVRHTLERIELVREGASVSTLVQVLAGFIWPRGSEIRERVLQSRNRWRDTYFTDPALARALLLDSLPPTISLSDTNWRIHLQHALLAVGTVRLAAAIGDNDILREALLEIVGTPLHLGPLHIYPTLDRVEQDARCWTATLALREVTG